MRVRRHHRGEGDAVLRQDVVVGDQGDTDQPVDVAHETLQPFADEAPDHVRALRTSGRTVVVEACEARIAGGQPLALQARRDARLL